MRKSRSQQVKIFFLLLTLITTSFSTAKISGQERASYFKISVTSEIHAEYGLSYPVTYVFSIEQTASNLVAYKRYREDSEWIQIPPKRSSDFFNGIEAARFDQENSRAYISVAFNPSSDNIFLKIPDALHFIDVATYYDDRDAVVVVSGDDWDAHPDNEQGFVEMINYLRQNKVWFTAGLVTDDHFEEWGYGHCDWDLVQEQLDLGWVEPASHSRTHKRVGNYTSEDYVSEVIGSRNDILDNLSMPDLNRSGEREYLYTWLAPFGEINNEVLQKLGEASYLCDRTVEDGKIEFVAWDHTYNLFNRIPVTTWGDNAYLDDLRSRFHNAITNKGIYHLFVHPRFWVQSGFTREVLQEHINQISGRRNIWYAGIGHLYSYRLVERVYNLEIQSGYYSLNVQHLHKLTVNVLDENHIPIENVYVNSAMTDSEGTAEFWGVGSTGITVRPPDGYYPKCVLNAESFSWNGTHYEITVDLTRDRSIEAILCSQSDTPSLYSSSQKTVDFFSSASGSRITLKAMPSTETLGTMTVRSIARPERVVLNNVLISEILDKDSFESNTDPCWFFSGEDQQILLKTDNGSATIVEIDFSGSPYLPYAKILSPFSGFNLGKEVEIRVEVNSFNFDWAELTINDTSVQTWAMPFVGPETWMYHWNTDTYPDGSYIVKLISYDKAGSVAEERITGLVDNTNPTVTMTSPRDGTALNGATIVEFEASDDNLELVQLIIDESTYDVTGEKSFLWNTTQVGDGKHVISLVVYDNAGNIAEASVTIATTNTRARIEVIVADYIAEIKRTRNIYLTIGAVVGLIAGIVAIPYIMLMRKREAGFEATTLITWIKKRKTEIDTTPLTTRIRKVVDQPIKVEGKVYDERANRWRDEKGRFVKPPKEIE